MTTALPAARLGEFWKALADPLRARRHEPLPRRLVETAAAWSGAHRAILYMREKDAWVMAASSDEQDGPALPDPIPTTPTSAGAIFWVPLESEGEVHGHLGLEGISPDDTEELALSVGFLLGALIAAHRLSRLVKEAEFEVKTRLLELESLYDLGLSLGGQLDLAALGDEVLYRSISLTDAGKGTLVLFDDGGKLLFERSLGGDLLPADQFASWRLPEGEAVINNAAATVPTAGERLSSCQKCLAVAISVLGRRLGVLAVADKESRDGGVLDFTPTDARLLSLFANQAAAAIETARLHKEAIEKERIERELELAAAIQREILPRSLPEIAGVELAAANLPTRQVGGDYYDFFPLSNGRLGFLVADVSGKGVPAALLVSTVHAAVHLSIDEAKTIVELVERIDRHLRRYAATRKFLTLFFGVIEPDSGLLRYVSAGHNPALLVSASGQLERLDSTGVPVGTLPNASWREETRTMQPGHLLAVYTDGLTEAVDGSDEEFGLERLERAIEKGRDLPAKQLCDEVLLKVADFARGMPQYDDQTLLLLRRI
ncbi:MAG TPA: GAF domain-containing SpoIIE family protein phosphatase [Thermoanaerobaculia bacterium]|nr:GAF domain-containing SpoIIE family protein phosphatase [Thermoanaerobaculia bacterium]